MAYFESLHSPGTGAEIFVQSADGDGTAQDRKNDHAVHHILESGLCFGAQAFGGNIAHTIIAPFVQVGKFAELDKLLLAPNCKHIMNIL